MSEEELKTQLKKEIRSLCETNSSVMTYMECLMKRYEQLEYKLQQKENIIKEVRKYIMSELITDWDIIHGGCVSGSDLPADAITPILEILDKENK